MLSLAHDIVIPSISMFLQRWCSIDASYIYNIIAWDGQYIYLVRLFSRGYDQALSCFYSFVLLKTKISGKALHKPSSLCVINIYIHKHVTEIIREVHSHTCARAHTHTNTRRHGHMHTRTHIHIHTQLSHYQNEAWCGIFSTLHRTLWYLSDNADKCVIISTWLWIHGRISTCHIVKR